MDTIINCAACDYVTLTTFDPAIARLLRNVFMAVGYEDTKTPARRMQYSGICTESMFIGNSDNQGDESHTMFSASSYTAYRVMRAINHVYSQKPMPNCSRIDLQVTVKRDVNDLGIWDYENELKSIVRENARGKPSSVWGIKKDNEIKETVYIGKRSSAKMLRVYDKKVGDDDMVRFEYEYKQQLANKVFGGVVASSSYAGATMKEQLRKYESVPMFSRALQAILQSDGEPLTIIREKTNDDSRLRWIRDTVVPVIKKMLLADSHGEELQKMLRELLELGD